MSSSVQFEIGKTRIDSPGATLGVVDLPHFRPLVFRVPAMLRIAEGEDALLGAGLLLVAPRAAEGRVELVLVERLAQADGLHDVRVRVRAMRKRADAVAYAVRIDMDEKVKAELLRHLVAE